MRKTTHWLLSLAGVSYVGLLIGLFAGEAETIPSPEIIRLGPVLAQALVLILAFFLTKFQPKNQTL